MTSPPPHLVCILGPTAIGKTKLAIQLAQHFTTEIISADSRQFYKEMNIGTAVPSTKELNSVTHHFIQHISINENYSVGHFERDADKTLYSLFQKHKTVILVGGSGLYVKAITDGLDEFPNVDEQQRNKLNKELVTIGLPALQNELKKVDPISYDSIDIYNPKRVIRALSIYRSSGEAYSTFLGQKKEKKKFKLLKIGITAPREIIYKRIEERVDAMMSNGLLEEAKLLFPHRELNALNTVGYKELFEFIKGNTSLPEAIVEIKKNTRRFAKRQMTWLNNKEKDVLWINFDTPFQDAIKEIEKKLASS